MTWLHDVTLVLSLNTTKKVKETEVSSLFAFKINHIYKNYKHSSFLLQILIKLLEKKANISHKLKIFPFLNNAMTFHTPTTVIDAQSEQRNCIFRILLKWINKYNHTLRYKMTIYHPVSRLISRGIYGCTKFFWALSYYVYFFYIICIYHYMYILLPHITYLYYNVHTSLIDIYNIYT